MVCFHIAFSAHARSKLAISSLSHEPMGAFAKQQCSKSWRKEQKRREQADQSLNTDSNPSKPNLLSLKKDGNTWKALKSHWQPHLGGPRRILLDNCIVGTGGRVSFRVTVGNSTGRGQDTRLMPQGDVQQERCNVRLALILAGFLLLSFGASERQCQRP